MTIAQYEKELIKNLGATSVDFKIDGRELIGFVQMELSDVTRQLGKVPTSFYVKVKGVAKGGKAKLPIINIGPFSILSISGKAPIEIVDGQDQFNSFKGFATDKLAYVSGSELITDYEGEFEASIYPNLLEMLEINPDMQMIGQEFLSIVSMKVKKHFAEKLAIQEDKVND